MKQRVNFDHWTMTVNEKHILKLESRKRSTPIWVLLVVSGLFLVILFLGNVPNRGNPDLAIGVILFSGIVSILFGLKRLSAVGGELIFYHNLKILKVIRQRIFSKAFSIEIPFDSITDIQLKRHVWGGVRLLVIRSDETPIDITPVNDYNVSELHAIARLIAERAKVRPQ